MKALIFTLFCFNAVFLNGQVTQFEDFYKLSLTELKNTTKKLEVYDDSVVMQGFDFLNFKTITDKQKNFEFIVFYNNDSVKKVKVFNKTLRNTITLKLVKRGEYFYMFPFFDSGSFEEMFFIIDRSTKKILRISFLEEVVQETIDFYDGESTINVQSTKTKFVFSTLLLDSLLVPKKNIGWFDNKVYYTSFFYKVKDSFHENINLLDNSDLELNKLSLTELFECLEEEGQYSWVVKLIDYKYSNGFIHPCLLRNSIVNKRVLKNKRFNK